MHFRSILSGSLVLLLLSGGAGLAQDSGSQGLFRLPGVFGRGNQETQQQTQGDVRLAQAADPRITALEEQIRTMSGTIEELNFQILQMQEQMRKMQEDNEFRFQELEKKGDAGGRGPRVAGTQPAAPSGEAAGAAATSGATAADGSGETAAPAAQETTIGSITFDADGNVKGGSVGDVIAADGATQADDPAKADGTTVAALPSTDDPEELYRNSYQFILSGDYATAEQGFRDHIARFPGSDSTADAHYWLGEALLGQQKYRDAAEVFLAANRDYPSAKKAPDMLLKLGVSLAGLKQRDVACATFAEVSKRYPKASSQLKERVKQEEALASC